LVGSSRQLLWRISPPGYFNAGSNVCGVRGCGGRGTERGNWGTSPSARLRVSIYYLDLPHIRRTLFHIILPPSTPNRTIEARDSLYSFHPVAVSNSAFSLWPALFEANRAMGGSAQGRQSDEGGPDSGNDVQTHQALDNIPQIHGGVSNPYQCAHCQRRYSRPEHLARHIKTHTLGKRFACTICGKAFARADLLKRHTDNHAPGESSTAEKRRRITSLSTQGRVSHACRACANARVRCEEQKPCTRCKNRSMQCEYTSSEVATTAAMQVDDDARLVMDVDQNRFPQASVYASVETTFITQQVQQLATPETVDRCEYRFHLIFIEDQTL